MSEKDYLKLQKKVPLESEFFAQTVAEETVKDMHMARLLGDNIVPLMARAVRKAFIVKGAALQGGKIE